MLYVEESQIFKHPKKTKIGLKIRVVWEIRGKITPFDCKEENNFGSS